jgi:acyl-ACP thioesterase
VTESSVGLAGAAYTAPYRVRFDEAGPDGALRTSGLLRYAQDVAWQHSEARGFTRAWYAERGLSWVVRAAALEVIEAIPMGTEVAVTTRVVGFQRVWAQRRAECRLTDGRVAAVVRTDWVMIDARGRLARVPAELLERFPAPAADGSVLRVPLPAPPSAAAHRSFAVRPHELDPMNHPNNAVYLDWLEESLRLAGEAGEAAVRARPRTIRLEYAAAPDPAAEVLSEAWSDGDRWCCHLTDASGTSLLRAEVR